MDSLPVALTAPLSLPLKPSTTLQALYDTISKHYDLTGVYACVVGRKDD